MAKLCMITEKILLTEKSSLCSQLNWRTWPQSWFNFLYNWFSTNISKFNNVMFNFFAEKKLLNSAQVVSQSTKMPKNEAKTDRNNFLWLVSALSFSMRTLYRLDLSRFVCKLSYLIARLRCFAKRECLHLSSSKLRCGRSLLRLRRASYYWLEIKLKLSFSTEIL